MISYQLGDRVTLTGTVEKRHRRAAPTVETYYETAPVPVLRSTWHSGSTVRVDTYATDGIIVGKRTLRPGHTRYYGDGPEWRPSPDTIEVYLVAFDLRSRPVMCLPNQLAPTETMTGRKCS